MGQEKGFLFSHTYNNKMRLYYTVGLILKLMRILTPGICSPRILKNPDPGRRFRKVDYCNTELFLFITMRLRII